MKVESTAFYTLTMIDSGNTCKCLRPKRSSSRGPFSGSPGSARALNEDETHSITVFDPSPPDLGENKVVAVAGVRYRIRKNPEKTRVGYRLSVAKEDVLVTQRAPR